MIQAAAKDALAGGPDQWAVDSTHKAEDVRKGKCDLWRILHFKTSLSLPKSAVVQCCACACGSFILPDSANWAAGGEGGLFFLFFLINVRIAVLCTALNSTYCTSTFTSGPPLFYQRSCKAHLKVHPEQRFASFTSVLPKTVKICIIGMQHRQKIFICPPWWFRSLLLPFFLSLVWLALLFDRP